MKLPSHSKTGTKSTVTVTDTLFAAPVNQQLLSQAVRVYRANSRQGTAKVKTRSEVARTKKKWYKQKGTGNARHGARSAHIFVGGGVAHGPDGNQNWSLSMSQQMKQKALISALSAQSAQCSVCDAVTDLTGKTKDAVSLFTSMGLSDERILIIVDRHVEQLRRATQNLQNVFVTTALKTNAYEIAQANHIVLTSDAITTLELRVTKATPGVAKTKIKGETAVVVTPEKTETVKKATSTKKPVVKKATVTKKTVTKTASKTKKTEK